jgi:hypothetical protein
MVFRKPAARLRKLTRMLKEDLLLYMPRLVCFTNSGGCGAANVTGACRGGNWGDSNNNAMVVSDACAGYIYFCHLPPSGQPWSTSR